MIKERQNLVILFGEDDFSRHTEREKLRSSLGSREETDANTSHFIFPNVSFDEVRSTCLTIPFLAETRLVIIEGLLGSFEPRTRTQEPSTDEKTKRSLGTWEPLSELVKDLPPTTVLLFLDKKLSTRNVLLQALKPHGKTVHCPSLNPSEVRNWVQQRVRQKSGSITPGAAKLLTELIGNNLWSMDTELEKLLTYAGLKTVTEEDVAMLVARAKEANIFAAIDAALEGHAGLALKLLHQLLEDGVSIGRIISMLARQNRLVILANYLLKQDITREEVTKRLGITAEFAVRKTIDQAYKYNASTLVGFHTRILETDIAVKTGQMADELSLELLVGEMASSQSKKDFERR